MRRGQFRKLAVLFVAICGTLASTLPDGAQAQSSSSIASPTAPTAAQPKPVVVSEDDRSETTDNGDGTKTVRVAARPTSVVKNGKRSAVDSGLRVQGGRLVADGVEEPVSIAQDSDAADLVVIGNAGRRIRLKRPNSSGLDVATSVQGVTAADVPNAAVLSAPFPLGGSLPGCFAPPVKAGDGNAPSCAAPLAAAPVVSTAKVAAPPVVVSPVGPTVGSTVGRDDDGEPVVAPNSSAKRTGRIDGEGIRDGERVKRTRKVRVKQSGDGSSSASFDGAFGAGSKLAYDVSSSGVKESIVLTAVPVSEAVFRFPLGLEGLTPAATQDGGFEFKDGAGKVAFSIPPAFAFDSTGGDHVPTNIHVGVPMELVGDATVGWTVAVRPPTAWLHSPDRVYPVTIDPTVNTGPLEPWNPMNLGTMPQGDPLVPEQGGGFHPLFYQTPKINNWGAGSKISTINFYGGMTDLAGNAIDLSKVSSVLVMVASYSGANASYVQIHPAGVGVGTSILNVKPWAIERAEIQVGLDASGNFTIDSGDAPSEYMFVQITGWYDKGVKGNPDGLRYIASNGIRLVQGNQSLAANPNGMSSLSVQVGGVGGVGGIPLGIKAVTLNITTGTTGTWGSMDVISNNWGYGFSNVGWALLPGYRARTVTVGVGPNGMIDLRGWSLTGAVTVFVDVLGWYQPANGGLDAGALFKTVNPFRAFNSRNFPTANSFTFNVADPSLNVQAVALSVVVLNPTGSTWANLFPSTNSLGKPFLESNQSTLNISHLSSTLIRCDCCRIAKRRLSTIQTERDAWA